MWIGQGNNDESMLTFNWTRSPAKEVTDTGGFLFSFSFFQFVVVFVLIVCPICAATFKHCSATACNGYQPGWNATIAVCPEVSCLWQFGLIDKYIYGVQKTELGWMPLAVFS